MRFTRLLIFFSFSLLISSCGGKNSCGSGKSVAYPSANIVEDKPGISKYGIKSGIIEYTSLMSGREAKQILCFDNYGAEESTETVLNVGKLKITSISIVKDSIIYTYNPDTKTGTSVAVLGRQSSSIDFRNLSEKMRRQMNLEITDTVTFDGRKCDEYSVDWVEMSLTGTYLVWEGITLKSDVRTGNTDMEMTATGVTENPIIPVAKFEVPPEVRIN
jgi:hypothetical protein